MSSSPASNISTGMCRVAGACLIARQTSKPSMSGRSASQSTRSQGCADKMRKAAAPSAAVSTRWPALSSMARSCPSPGSSSTAMSTAAAESSTFLTEAMITSRFEKRGEPAEVALGRHSHEGERAVVLAALAKNIRVHRANLSQLAGGAALEKDLQGLPEPLVRFPPPAQSIRGRSLHGRGDGLMQVVARSTGRLLTFAGQNDGVLAVPVLEGIATERPGGNPDLEVILEFPRSFEAASL